MLIGIVIGLSIGLIGMFYSTKSYKDTLILKSEKKNRTPEKLGDNFYYIIPVEEYLETEQYSLFWKYKNEVKNNENN